MPGFYFHLEPPNAMVAAGMYIFLKRLLPHYCPAAAEDKDRRGLSQGLGRHRQAGRLHPGRAALRPGAQGLPAGASPAELLRHNRIYLFQEVPLPEETYSPALVD